MRIKCSLEGKVPMLMALDRRNSLLWRFFHSGA